MLTSLEQGAPSGIPMTGCRGFLFRRRWKLIAGLLLLAAAVGFWPRPKPWPAEVRRLDLELRGDRLFLPGESRPYSGLLVSDFSGTAQRKTALPLKDGKITGVVRSWHENGNLEVEEPFVDGVSQGLRTRWHPDGSKRSEAEIVQGKLQGRYTEWHPNGRKALEMTLADGKGEGLAEAWHASGRLKSRTQLVQGKPAESHFFADDAASTPIQPGETAAMPVSDSHE